jgi:poly(beta-D-mannuronate) lyase
LDLQIHAQNKTNMLRSFLLQCCLLFSFAAFAETIPVKNIEELKAANKSAKPGDIIILQNGEWSNATIELNCNGTASQPITFKAATAGKVMITGKSRLALGGSFIVIDGWYFTSGYAGSDAVIDFRIDKNQLANDCRVTNTVIDNFNNPKRMDENYWVSFSGKRNRIDHCTFQGKKNMGVLMAIILDDDRSRENFHSIDHNYFGERPPLASNSGEIIRIGVSQHCRFNSNTQVVDNFFEHCDGETEIVSVKSCSNVVRNNLFKECQGGVVLRHGNYNTVENNVFLGNGKDGTGGVRIINKGQWVVNNYFYECRGEGFRSPLSIMNGVPNSPDNRYVEVTDAVVANNSWINCTPISLCEGSDTERSVTPRRVVFQNNAFFNTKDKKIYNAYDDISRISFRSNAVSNDVPQDVAAGFIKVNASSKKVKPGNTPFNLSYAVSDSLNGIAKTRLKGGFSAKAGYNSKNYNSVIKNAERNSGAAWFVKMKMPPAEFAEVLSATNGEELAKLLANNGGANAVITLSDSYYDIKSPILVTGNVTLTTAQKLVRFSSGELPYIFQIQGGSSLRLDKFSADLSDVKAKTFITSDLSGSSDHSEFVVTNSNFNNLGGDFFFASKSTMLDSVAARLTVFRNIKGTLFNFNNETDKKGYYNAEHVTISNCTFANNSGQLLGMLRGGNDESTMGPLLAFTNNNIENSTSAAAPLIYLYGTQRSAVTGNTFTNTSKNQTLIQYADAVRAVHSLFDNRFSASGNVITNKFTTEENNITTK